jgi:thiamine-monophosphate kinase
VLGHVPAGEAILRSGARPGDSIFVTGALGEGAAAIQEFSRRRGRRKIPDALLCPTPRVAVGEVLRKQNLATALIDISDGLSTDLDHLCEAGGVGAELNADWIPRARLPWQATEVGLEMALNGGEDYELLFTVSPGIQVPGKIAGVLITMIGRILSGRRMYLVQNGKKAPMRAAGWEHFR